MEDQQQENQCREEGVREIASMRGTMQELRQRMENMQEAQKSDMELSERVKEERDEHRRLEREVNMQHRQQQQPGVSQPFALPMPEIPPYNPDDPTKSMKSWLDRVFDNAIAHGLTEAETCRRAKKALLATTERMREYDRIDQALRSRKKRRNETALEYVREMERLGVQAGASQKEVTRWIIMGAASSSSLQGFLQPSMSRGQIIKIIEDQEAGNHDV